MNKINFNIALCVVVFQLLSFSSASEIPPQSAVVFGDDEKSCVCGRSKQSRIISGQEAYPAEFPWMVRIYVFDEHKCGGSLITRRHVLTAAHCLLYLNIAWPNYTIIQTMDDKNRSVDNLYLHESYDRNLTNNDIGIVKLSSPVNLGGSLRTICLPQYQYFHNQDQWGIVIGWGYAQFREISDHLLKASVKLMSGQDCVKNSFWEQESITENMFCAIGNHYEDACHGDSGGPLQVRNSRGAMELAGIVSKGKQDICGDRRYPGVYTNVYRYLNWIYYYIRDENLCQSL